MYGLPRQCDRKADSRLRTCERVVREEHFRSRGGGRSMELTRAEANPRGNSRVACPHLSGKRLRTARASALKHAAGLNPIRLGRYAGPLRFSHGVHNEYLREAQLIGADGPVSNIVQG